MVSKEKARELVNSKEQSLFSILVQNPQDRELYTYCLWHTRNLYHNTKTLLNDVIRRGEQISTSNLIVKMSKVVGEPKSLLCISQLFRQGVQMFLSPCESYQIFTSNLDPGLRLRRPHDCYTPTKVFFFFYSSR